MTRMIFVGAEIKWLERPEGDIMQMRLVIAAVRANQGSSKTWGGAKDDITPQGMKYLVPGTTKLAWNMVKHLRPASLPRSLDIASECPEGHVEE
jgi:hypothetical protein